MVKRKTRNPLSMQIIGELLVQMGLIEVLQEQQRIWMPDKSCYPWKKKQQPLSSKVQGRLLCDLNYLFPVTSVQCQLMQCPGRVDHYNSHTNNKAAIKLNYNSKVKKKTQTLWTQSNPYSCDVTKERQVIQSHQQPPCLCLWKELNQARQG